MAGAPRPDAAKPFEDEHSCRLAEPAEFDRFRRSDCEDTVDGRCIDVIFGITEGDDGEESVEWQAIRYPVEGWDEADAREHCAEQDSIKFEPAEDSEDSASACGSCGTTQLIMTPRTTDKTTGDDNRVREVKANASADAVVTREVDDEDMEVLRVPISSTRQDRDGDAFSEAALNDMASQIKQQQPLVHDDHGAVGGGIFARYPARETIGTQIDAEVEPTDDDHHVLYAYINPDGTHPDGEGERMLRQVRDEKQAIKFSVGFRILKTNEDIDDPENVPDRAREIPGRLFMETDLFETSRVGIPSNPDATAAMTAKDGVPLDGGRVPVALLSADQIEGLTAKGVDRETVEDATPTHVDGTVTSAIDVLAAADLAEDQREAVRMALDMQVPDEQDGEPKAGGADADADTDDEVEALREEIDDLRSSLADGTGEADTADTDTTAAADRPGADSEETDESTDPDDQRDADAPLTQRL